jgi:CRP/FNR family transcriptional regulator
MYGRGAVIFSYGSYPRGVFCIHSGHVKLTRPTPDGREHILRLAGAGDLVGYASMIGGEPYTLNCIAVEESSVCFVPMEVILSMVRENTQLALRVMQDLSHEVEDAERRVVEIAQKSIRERVAEALLVIKEESVIRTLSEFKSKNLIEISGKSIRLKNVKGLIKTANLID